MPVVDETVDPVMFQGTVSLPLAKQDPLYTLLLRSNNRSHLAIGAWLTESRGLPGFPRARVDRLDDSFPVQLAAVSRPVYDAGGKQALIWYSAFTYVPREFGGPFLTPDDKVLRFARVGDSWELEKTYAFSPD
jgi:hypothetical protein